MAKRVESITEKLFVCAKKEFLEKGFNDASLRTIAKNSGSSTGAIYIRYPDKEALFDALVTETIDNFFSKFRAAQDAHFDLISQNKTNTSIDLSQEYLYVFVNYMYDHFDEFRLILCCSDGTKHQNFIHDLVNLEVVVATQYHDNLREQGKLQGKMHPDVHHMLVSAYYTTLFEVVKHNMKREDALMHIKEISTFFNAGWNSLLMFL